MTQFLLTHPRPDALRLVEALVKTMAAGEFDERAMEQEFVVDQILRLSTSLDLSDEFGRRRLVALVRHWITSPHVPSTLSEQLLRLYAVLEPKVVCDLWGIAVSCIEE